MDPEPSRTEQITLPHGTAVVFCARSPVKETPNEDGAAVVALGDVRAVLAVADGMGGAPAGDRASDLALETLLASVRSADDGEGLRPAILNGFERANERVLETFAGAGTTLAAVEIDGRAIRPYHVGDSVILVAGQRGKLKLQTVAHSPVGYAVEAGLLDESDAMHHHERHLVSNFVGAPDMRIEVGPSLELSARDTVVLGSDGLFDNLHIEEIVGIVRKGPLAAVAEKLASLALRRMVEPEPGTPSKADDLTFIVYRPDPTRP